jgi:Glyoxalase/Bleomycin resistance protein/Dioxygenase superfamily
MSPSIAKLTSSAAVLLVKDVVASANHYRDKMGFQFGQFVGEPPSFVILHRDGQYLMLKQADDAKHVVPHWTVSEKLWNVYFWVSDVESLHREFVARGAIIDYGLCDQPYGCREFGTQDLNGYDIGFGQFVGEK